MADVKLTKEQEAALPPGVNWENSPIHDFSRFPTFTAFPDMARLLQVGYMCMCYGGWYNEGTQIRLLDVAAGMGELCKVIRNQRPAAGVRWTYTGVDVDPRKHSRALEECGKDLDYRIADITRDLLKVCPPSEPFDIIASTEFLEHITKPDGEKFLFECMKLLKPGGHFILTSANPNLRRNNQWHIYEWPPEELRAYIDSQGWNIVDWFYMKAGIRDLRPKIGTEIKENRVPNELVRGVMSSLADTGSVTVVILRK